MKIRNKKTGEVFILIDHIFDNYTSLAQFNKEWEDAPAEPLIKDEKVRRAVSLWLSVQEQPIVEVAITCNKDNDGFFNYHLYGYIEEARISNGKAVKNKNLTAIGFEFRSLEKMEFDVRRDYTIAELCGEEEKWLLHHHRTLWR